MNQKRSHFNLNAPKIQPDETLYSWLGYIHLVNAHASVLDTSTKVTGDKFSGLQHDFPANVQHILTQTNLKNCSAPQLALEHTLLGFYLPFKPAKLCEKILSTVIKSKYPNLKYKLGIPASGLRANHPLKLCNQCATEDINLLGRPYWHLPHQPPSVYICTKHETPLRFLDIHSTPVHLREWLFPVINDSRLKDIHLEFTELSKILKLATFTDSLISQPPASFNQQLLTETYRRELLKRGELTSFGSVRLNAFKLAFLRYFGEYAQLPFSEILQSVHNEQSGFLGSLLRKNPKPCHPFKHLLLITFLFDSWDNFLQSYSLSERSPNPTVTKLTKPQIPENKGIQDPRRPVFLRLAQSGELSIRAASLQAGVSVTTGVQWAKQANITFTSRAKVLTPNLLARLHQDLRTGLSKRDISQQHNVSVVSINRILRADSGLRGEWQQAVFLKLRHQYRDTFNKLVGENPGVPIKRLRKIPGSGYGWLYRHDRSWLIQNLPSLWKG